ncbi:NADP-dependent malic enzyme [Candidatus Woesearchaeota archaeon]|nr:NADP-dependent malic enzyme [Candidatus Woesearchaeota archaeon]
MSDLMKDSLKLHKENKGKLAIAIKTPVKDKRDLALVYTPGVAEPCKEIAKNKETIYDYTFKGNTVAVISDGSSVLGLGNIGAEAALPVMEGKCVLFKQFANIDAFPICLATQDPQEIIKTVKHIAPVFGGINLEDIKAPQCFEVEGALQQLGIPVMHDDQHGTAVVVLAGLLNALKVVGKKHTDIRITVNGAGAAGTAIIKILLHYGVPEKNIIICDTKGIIHSKRLELKEEYKKELAKITNTDAREGLLAHALIGADVLIGVSKANVVTETMIKTMAKDAIVFAMANPIPEIMPELAKKAGAKVVATGRSDFPNQVNNALGFPGIFRGALDAKATEITTAMKLAAAQALAGMIKNPDFEKILPEVIDSKVVPCVAEAVKKVWLKNNKGL